MNRARRLNRLNRGLTARERAALCVRATLDGVPEDPLIRETMPLTQVEHFNRYIAQANGVLHVLPYVFCFAKEVECALLRFDFLLQLNSEEAARVLADRVPRDFRELWAALLAYEQLSQHVVAEFGDPVIVPTVMSEKLARSRSLLLELREAAKPFIGDLKFPPVDAVLANSLRAGVRRDERMYL